MSTQRIPRPAKRFLYLVFTAVFACPAGAGETYWQHDPNVPGDWFDANNWTAGLPTSHWTSRAYIDNGGTALISSGDAVAGTEYVGYSFAGAVTQTVGTHTVEELQNGRHVAVDGRGGCENLARIEPQPQMMDL